MNPVLPKEARKNLKIAIRDATKEKDPTQSLHLEAMEQNSHLEDANQHLSDIKGILKDQKESPDLVQSTQQFLKSLKGEKGDKGDKGEGGYTPVKGKDYVDGHTPQRGVDYLHAQDLQFLRDNIATDEVLKKATPIKGVHYRDGVDGRPGKDGVDGKDGRTIKGPPGEPGKDGRDGKDAKSLNPKDVIKAIQELPEKDKPEISILRNGQEFLRAYQRNTNRVGGAGVTKLIAGPGVTITSASPAALGLGDVTISASGGSGTVTSVASADGSITVTNPTTTVDLAVVKAPKLTTGRTVSITGDLAYTSASFDGSGNVTGTGNLASVITAGGPTGSATVTPIITYDAKGRLTTVSSATITPAASSITGAGDLTKTNDTNVTLTLGGTPTGSLLKSTSLTLGWTGTLSPTRGGTGTDTSASTGVAQVSSGTWSFSTALANGTTATTQTATDNSTKVATDAYVTTAIANAIAGVNPAVAVQAATTAAGDTSGLTYNNGVGGIGAFFTGSTNTAITIDGFTFTTLGQRLLVKNDTQSPSGAFNGIYYVTQLQTAILPPILTRALDYDMPSDINNTGAIPVVNGTVNALTSWLLTSTVTTVGTDPLTYSLFSYSPTAAGIKVGSSVITSGTTTRILYDNSGVLGEYTISGSGTVVAMATSPSFTTPTLGVATATSINGNIFTTGTYTLTGVAGKTLTFNKSITLDGTDSTTMTFPSTSATIARTDAAQTFTGIQTIPQILCVDNAVTATSNAATVTRSNRNNVVTNNSAAGITITLSTSGATAGDMLLVQSLPSSAVAQSITWVNTENSDVTPSANLNASTTSPRTDGFKWNSLTSKWRCIASA